MEGLGARRQEGAVDDGAEGAVGGTPVKAIAEGVNADLERRFGLGDNACLLDYIATMMKETATTASNIAQRRAQDRLDELEIERKKKKDERRKARHEDQVEDLDPIVREKTLRKRARYELKRKREEDTKREERRETMPLIDLTKAGHPAPTSYFLFKNKLSQVLKANFKPYEGWTEKKKGVKRTEVEKTFIVEQIRDRFRNGGRISASFIVEKILKSLTDKRNHVRSQIRAYLASAELESFNAEDVKKKGCPPDIDNNCWNQWVDKEIAMKHWLQKDTCEREIKTLEASLLTIEDRATSVELQSLQEKLNCLLAIPMAEPPEILQRAAKRARNRGAVGTHKLGQGGTSQLQAEFVMKRGRRARKEEIAACLKLGTKAVLRRIESELCKEDVVELEDEEGEDEDENEEEDEDEDSVEAEGVHGTSVGSTVPSRDVIFDSQNKTGQEEEEEVHVTKKKNSTRSKTLGSGRARGRATTTTSHTRTVRTRRSMC